MVGNVGAAVARGLQTIASRVAGGGGEARAAGEGSFLGRAIQWLKTAFHTGAVRPDTERAYADSTRSFMAAGVGGASGAARPKVELAPVSISDELKADVETDLIKNIDLGAPGCALKMEDVQGRPGQKICTQMVTDINRQQTLFNGQPFTLTPGRSQQQNAADWHDMMRSKDVSSDDIAVLSRLCNQSTPGCLFVPVFVQGRGDFKTTDGQPLFISAQMNNQKYDIIDKGDRRFQVEMSCEGYVNLAMITGSGQSVYPGEGSLSSMRMTIDVEPDASGRLAMKQLSSAGVDVKIVETDQASSEKFLNSVGRPQS